MNAFHGTNLDNLLRGFGTEHLVVTGAWTNFSIEHTARHAADAGYHAIVVTDGTSTIDDGWQNAGLNFALQMIADRASTKEVVAVLGRAKKKPAAKPKATTRGRRWS